MSWGRGRASSHASSDPILNRDVFRQKARSTDKKSIVSRMRRLFEPKPQKPAGELPEGLKGFFEPVTRSVKPPSPVEILSDSEYKPPTEREWNYLMTEPIFKKGYLQPPAYRRHITAATDPNQQTPSVNNNLGISHFKKQFEESFDRSTQAGTAEGMYKFCLTLESLRSNTNHIQSREDQLCERCWIFSIREYQEYRRLDRGSTSGVHLGALLGAIGPGLAPRITVRLVLYIHNICKVRLLLQSEYPVFREYLLLYSTRPNQPDTLRPNKKKD